MDLTTLDRELLDGLQVLTDAEISRVQAHLAAGLPMQRDYGWLTQDWTISDSEEVSCFGCLIGVSMSPVSYRRRSECYRNGVAELAGLTFPDWAAEAEEYRSAFHAPLARPTLDRLAALLDMEWSRRHPLPAESRHAAIIPSLEAVPV